MLIRIGQSGGNIASFSPELLRWQIVLTEVRFIDLLVFAITSWLNAMEYNIQNCSGIHYVKK